MTQDEVKKENKKPNLLIVDDDERVREAFGKIFSKKFNITLSSSGNKAKVIIKNQKFDVILSDYHMIDGDGIVVLEAASEVEVPVIMFTGANEHQVFIKISNKRPFFTFDKMAESSDILSKLNEAVALKKEIENKNRMQFIGENSSRIFHDINNPLMVISGTTEKIQLMEENLSLEANKNLEKISSMTDRITDLVKIQKGRSLSENIANLVLTNVKTFIQDFLEEQKDNLDKNKVKVELSCDENCWAKIDRFSFVRVIANLLENSMYEFNKNNQENRVVSISVTRKEDDVCISVKDNGRGIPQEIVVHLFKHNYTNKPSKEGSGLGLTTCKEIVEDHMGKIEAFTAEGAHFLIKLPTAA